MATRLRSGTAFALSLTLALALAGSAAALEASCTDGVDDDADALTDCADPDCGADALCRLTVVRDLSLLREPGTGRPYLNLYLLSWPDVPNWRDAADTRWPGGDKCVGAIGGPSVPDGVLNFDDLICMLWGDGDLSAREGTFRIQTFDGCQYHDRTATRGGIIGVQFTGTVMPLDPRDGYEVLISSSSPTVTPTSTVLLSGTCDPAWPPYPIVYTGRCGCPFIEMQLLQFPWDLPQATADEILCGIENVDWDDLDGDGDPDTCPAGVFDGATPITLSTYDNLITHGYVRRTVMATDLGLAFLGADFAIANGESYLIGVRPGHQPTVFDTHAATRCP
jgi:hypothetical protein